MAEILVAATTDDAAPNEYQSVFFELCVILSPNAKAQRRRGSDWAEGKDALPGVLCSAWFGAVSFEAVEGTVGMG